MSRIVFKTRVFPKKSETFIVRNICHALDQGFDVRVVVRKILKDTESSQQEKIESYKLMERVSKFHSPQGKFNRLLKAFIFLIFPVILIYFFKYCISERKISLAYIFRLHFYRFVRKNSVFHVHFGTAVNPLLLLKKIGYLKSKIIVTFHGYDAFFLSERKSSFELVNSINNYVDYITVNSFYLKNQLLKKGIDNELIRVIPVGYDEELFKTEEKRFENSNLLDILSVGRLIELKGHSYGLDVVKELKNRGYDIRYSIVGEGNLFESLRSKIENLELEDSVFLLGGKSQIEIREIMKQHEILLMTSTYDDLGRQEAFGVVSLEAQAMGLPVVGFNSGGFPETVLEGVSGLIVEDRNIKQMATAVERLLKDRSLLQMMSRGAINHIKEKYKSNNTTMKYIDLYKKCIHL